MPNKMFNCEIKDEEVEKVVKEYFTPEEWENLADIFKIRYRNMYRNYLSLSGDGGFMPLPEFMRKSKENQTNTIFESNNKPKKNKSKTRKRSATDNLNVRRNPKRNVCKIDYYEPEEPKEDRYVYCDNCGKEYLDFCSKCGMLVSLKDYPVAIGTEDRAKKTIPKDVLEIRPSQIHGFGVFTVRTLRKGIQMGPYEGEITRVNTTNGYSWKLRDGKLIDAGDQTNSNWMRYVNCARNVTEQNTVAFQYKGNLYYRTCKEIEKGEELLVYYGQNFAKVLGIDTKKYFQPDEEEVNLAYFTCEYCYVGLSTSEFRDSHQRRCKFRPNRMVVYSNESFICQYCNCSLTTMEYLKKHEKYCRQKNKNKEETGCEERKHQCQYCEYKSSQKCYLKKHVKFMHERWKCPKFQCEKCKYETVDRSNLRVHTRTHDSHERIVRYKCTVCPNEGFNSKANLDNHVFCHHKNLRHLITSKVHRCSFCNYETVTVTYLRYHAQVRHPEKAVGAKKYLCNICDYSTILKSNFNRHVRTHAKSVHFVCRECSYTSNQKSQLDGHILRRHPLNTNLLQMISNKIHNCHVCPYRTIQKANFTRHMKTHNNKDKRDRN